MEHVIFKLDGRPTQARRELIPDYAYNVIIGEVSNNVTCTELVPMNSLPGIPHDAPYHNGRLIT